MQIIVVTGEPELVAFILKMIFTLDAGERN